MKRTAGTGLLLGLLLAAAAAQADAQTGQGGLQGALQGRSGRIGQVAGQIEVLAQQQDFDEATKTYVFDGNVELRQANVFTLTASRVVYYAENGWLHAEGPVLLSAGKDVLSGNAATYNVQTRRAKVYNAHGVLEPSLIVEARSIEKLAPHAKTGEDRFYIEQGVFTSCHRPGTGWSLRARTAVVHMNNYLHLYGVRFEVRGVPLFYMPYYVQSIKRDRTTGFLPPRFGFDSVWGPFLAMEFFWAIAGRVDLSIAATPYAATRVDAAAELRFRLSGRDPVNVINVLYQRFFDEAKLGLTLGYQSLTRLVALLNHTFRSGFVVTANINRQNNRLPNDPAQNFEERARQYSISEASVSRAFGSHNLRLTGYVSEGVPNGLGSALSQESLFEVLPRLTYSSGAPWNLLGNNLQLVIEGAQVDRLRRRDAVSLSAGGQELLDRSLWRASFVPRLQGTITLPGVSIQPSLALIENWWSERRAVDPTYLDNYATYAAEPNDPAPSEFGTIVSEVGDGLFRHAYRMGVNVTGPSFYRLYSTDVQPEGKLKHLIQPTANYQYIPFVNEYQVMDLEGGVGRLGLGQHQVSYTLSNILLYKWKGQTTPTEVFRFDVGQTYRFLRDVERLVIVPPPRALGDLGFGLQVRLPRYSLTSNLQLESDEWRVRRISASGSVNQDRWFAQGDYLRTAVYEGDPAFGLFPEGTVNRHSVTLAAGVRLGPSWQLRGRGVYNLLDGILADSFLDVGYRRQCWGLSLGGGLVERKVGTAVPDEFGVDRNVSVSFSVHLLNLGSLGTEQRVR